MVTSPATMGIWIDLCEFIYVYIYLYMYTYIFGGTKMELDDWILPHLQVSVLVGCWGSILGMFLPPSVWIFSILFHMGVSPSLKRGFQNPKATAL